MKRKEAVLADKAKVKQVLRGLSESVVRLPAAQGLIVPSPYVFLHLLSLLRFTLKQQTL